MLSAKNNTPKCTGEGCADRVRCGRFLRPAGEHQAYEPYWKAGDKCQSYESVPAEYHEAEEWDESRVDVIGQNGNDGLHYD